MVLPAAMLLMGRAVKEKYDRDQEDAVDRQAERDARAERRTWEREDRDFQRGERQRMVKNRDAVAAAAAPVEPASGEVFQPAVDDEGNAMPANPTAGTFMVDGQRFSDRTAATEAANTPERTAQRVSRAMMSTGDMAGAQAVRTGARQEKQADLQISQATAAAERDRALREVGQTIITGGWSAVPQVYDKYRDGMKATVKEDGKGGATITYAGPDGKTVGSKTYAALPEFFADVAGGLDPAKWFDYQNNKADKDRVAAHQAAVLAEQKRHNMATEATQRYEASTRAAALKASAAGAAPTADAGFDEKTAADIAKDMVKKEAEADSANGKPWSGAQVARRKDEIVETLRQTHQVRVIENTVARTLTAAKANPAAYATEYAKARQLGMPPARLQQMGFADPGGPAPGAPAAPNPWRDAPPGGGTVVDGRVVPQGSAAPAPARMEATPQPAAAEAPFADFLAKNITSPAGKQMIAQRIRRDLPRLQETIKQDTQVMTLPMVSGAVKQRLKARIEAAAQEAEMMETFLAGNAGI